MTIKTCLKKLLPPVIVDFYRFLHSTPHDHIDWTPCISWEEAKKASFGYQTQEIFEKVYSACALVRDGKAVYERDSVIFDSIQYEWPLTASLMAVASMNNGNLNIIDFGGSLGSTFYSNLKFLKLLHTVRWNIVEQKHFVNCGVQEFTSDQLFFYESIDECFENTKPNCILFSSVLQYLDFPYELLNKLLDYNFKFLVLDRMTNSKSPFDIPCIQSVPECIYKARYPCWKLSQAKILNVISKNFDLVETWDSLADDNTTWGCLAVHK